MDINQYRSETTQTHVLFHSQGTYFPRSVATPNLISSSASPVPNHGSLKDKGLHFPEKSNLRIAISKKMEV